MMDVYGQTYSAYRFYRGQEAYVPMDGCIVARMSEGTKKPSECKFFARLAASCLVP